MELKSLTTYKHSFQIIKTVLIVTVLVSGLIVIFTIYQTQLQKQQLRQMIYVINTEGNVFQATGVDQSVTRIYEYENHVRTFYTLWYQFDEGSFTRNIETALPLIGESGRVLLDEYKEQNILRRLQERNLRLTVDITRIEINVNTNPVSGIIEGVQSIQRGTHVVRRQLNASFILLDFDRSRDNPHGVKIENWVATAVNIE